MYTRKKMQTKYFNGDFLASEKSQKLDYNNDETGRMRLSIPSERRMSEMT